MFKVIVLSIKSMVFRISIIDRQYFLIYVNMSRLSKTFNGSIVLDEFGDSKRLWQKLLQNLYSKFDLCSSHFIKALDRFEHHIRVGFGVDVGNAHI